MSFAVDMPANIVSRCIQDAKRTDGDVVGGAATSEKENAEKETSGRFHALSLSPFPAAATQFLTSATKSAISLSLVAQEHMNR